MNNVDKKRVQHLYYCYSSTILDENMRKSVTSDVEAVECITNKCNSDPYTGSAKKSPNWEMVLTISALLLILTIYHW